MASWVVHVQLLVAAQNTVHEACGCMFKGDNRMTDPAAGAPFPHTADARRRMAHQQRGRS